MSKATPETPQEWITCVSHKLSQLQDPQNASNLRDLYKVAGDLAYYARGAFKAIEERLKDQPSNIPGLTLRDTWDDEIG